MNKLLIALLILSTIMLAIALPANASAPKANIVVAGCISHGPMQPTVKAIKEVLANYGDRVNVEWIDSDTPDGKKYFDDHKLSAHLNVIINGKSTCNVNGKDVTFQWFEGKQWTKNDLDAAISGILNG
jgi:hypothetical protein